MKQCSLRTGIVLRFALIVLTVILVVSIASNLLIHRQFEQYVKEQQDVQAEEIAQMLISFEDINHHNPRLQYIA